MLIEQIEALNSDIGRLENQLRRTGYVHVSHEEGVGAGLFTRLFSRAYRRRQAAYRIGTTIDARVAERARAFAAAYGGLQSGSAQGRLAFEANEYPVRQARDAGPRPQNAVSLDRMAREGWSIEQIAALFTKLGYGVSQAKASDGSPIVVVEKAGWKIGVIPSRLGELPRFSILHLVLLVEGTPFSAAQANVWNRASLLARLAVLDDGRILLSADSLLIGASELNLAYFVWFCEVAIDEFRKLLV